MRTKFIEGQRFNRLTLVRFSRIDEKRQYKWICKCDCGTEKEFHISAIATGNTLSCGCHRNEAVSGALFKHGHSGNPRIGTKASREYKAWCHAKSRCYTKTDAKYKDYGARGIKMCQRWLDSFSAFFEDMGNAPKGKTLDREDVNGNYEPGNCRWASASIQANNTRFTIKLTLPDQSIVTIRDLANMTGVKKKSLEKRYYDHGAERLIASVWPLLHVRD